MTGTAKTLISLYSLIRVFLFAYLILVVLRSFTPESNARAASHGSIGLPFLAVGTIFVARLKILIVTVIIVFRMFTDFLDMSTPKFLHFVINNV